MTCLGRSPSPWWRPILDPLARRTTGPVGGSPSRPLLTAPWRTGLALPLVILFVFCTFTFGSYLFFFRKEIKQQNMLAFHALQAEFLAQAAIQHALLKIQFFRQEVFDAGAAEKGLCPFQAVRAQDTVRGGPNRSVVALDILRGDCTSAALPFASFDEPEVDALLRTWEYQVASLSVLSGFSDVDPTRSAVRVQVVRVTGEGKAIDPMGGRGARTETMTKTFHLRRAN